MPFSLQAVVEINNFYDFPVSRNKILNSFSDFWLVNRKNVDDANMRHQTAAWQWKKLNWSRETNKKTFEAFRTQLLEIDGKSFVVRRHQSCAGYMGSNIWTLCYKILRCKKLICWKQCFSNFFFLGKLNGTPRLLAEAWGKCFCSTLVNFSRHATTGRIDWGSLLQWFNVVFITKIHF